MALPKGNKISFSACIKLTDQHAISHVVLLLFARHFLSGLNVFDTKFKFQKLQFSIKSGKSTQQLAWHCPPLKLTHQHIMSCLIDPNPSVRKHKEHGNMRYTIGITEFQRCKLVEFCYLQLVVCLLFSDFMLS